MKPSELYRDFNFRESPYMPTLLTKSPVLLQKKTSEGSISRDLLNIYLKLRKKRKMIERSQCSETKKS
jgi:hypothetical protein